MEHPIPTSGSLQLSFPVFRLLFPSLLFILEYCFTSLDIQTP